MPINKFKFVSPGVQVAEIDNSQLPATPVGSGPVIIGRAEKGPAMRPVQVNSFSDFVSTFGMPWAGKDNNEVWRYGNKMAPSYGVYAAQAYLRNSSPLTFVRLLGDESDEAGTTSAAGAAGWKVGSDSENTGSGGNYGLFVFDASSTKATGTLAAVFYANSSAIRLKGDGLDDVEISGTACFVKSKGTNYEFQVQVVDSTGVLDTINFNFDKNSRKYIRKVFNTNPTTINSNISAVAGADAKYFLGETFDRDVDALGATTSTGGQSAMIVRLAGGSDITHNNRLRPATGAQTGWVLSQYLGDSGSFDPDPNNNKLTKLFKIRSLSAGAWESQNLKIAISDVRASTSEADPYGTFSVEIRQAKDNDSAPEFIERFGACNLNPNSPNYVARKIGDKFQEWDQDNARYIEYGTYENRSSLIYVQMAEDVTNGMVNESLVPFGFEGPVRFKSFQFDDGDGTLPAYAYADNTLAFDDLADGAGQAVYTAGESFDTLVRYPQAHYRVSSSQGELPSPKDAYWGFATGRNSSYNTYEESNIDLVRAFPRGLPAIGDRTSDYQTASFYYDGSDETTNTFTLDELAYTDDNQKNAKWNPGSHVNGTSISTTGSNDWRAVLTAGFDKFTLPFLGGFDGVDITESDPFNARVVDDGRAASENYSLFSVRKAIDTVADPEVVDTNLLAVPGNYAENITSHLLTTAEKRADAIAVIDLDGGYVPEEVQKPTVSAAGVPNNRGSVESTIDNLRNRAINSSYGAAYYPWVQIRDTETSQLLYAPPSIAAIGTYSSAQRNTEVWFAPAGFTRGGLTEGSAGIPVVGVAQRLSSKDRDDLYEANINPIATFPAEGIVIFGQKTLQVTPSALDRVNVRRLMIYVKKEISRMAATLLFDQNVSQTWARFTGQANPFLESIKQRLGLEDYKVVLDTTTTTPDLVDRNIMYAKIFLKPARAIEYIAIDFVITNAGASFED